MNNIQLYQIEIEKDCNSKTFDTRVMQQPVYISVSIISILLLI